MNESTTEGPGRSFVIIGVLALLWNALGIFTYLMQVLMTQEALSELPPDEAALYANIPAWVTSAYAIAVFGGTLACIALLLRKAWAVPVFVVSLLAILVQMGHALFMTDLLAVRGSTAAILPLVIIGVAVFLVWYSTDAKKKGLLS